MSLIRWNSYDPFYEIGRMMNRMQSIMDRALAPFEGNPVQPRDANLLDFDMTSDDKRIIVRAPLPGFSENEVSVDVRGNVLTIAAESKKEREDQQANWHIREIRYGKFARSVLLPAEVSTDKADAWLENGILTVELPKKKPSLIQKIAGKARNLLKGGNSKKA